ncbi:MAG: YIP1 family protein [Desulfovermiculus sp.]|nr:YIP1 family protein [Desulfovermiculus sp.]
MEIKCPECGFIREVPEDKIPPTAKMATCPKCKQKFFFREDPLASSESREESSESEDDPGKTDSENRETQAPEEDIWSQLESLSDNGPEGEEYKEHKAWQERKRTSGGQGEIPWENLKDYGFFPGLIETIKLVMFQPQDFFARMPLGRGLSMPVIFYLLVAEVQALAQFIWRMAGVVPQMGQGGGDFLGLGLAGVSSLLVLILYPVFLAGMLFVVSGLNHVCLMAVKAGTKGYEGTFKVISYANAPMVLAILPLFGPLVGMVWTMVCTFLGFKYVHQTTNLRVLMAMLLPLLILLLLSSLFVSARGMT